MTKEIQLTQGRVALVDDEDFERISKYKWSYHSRYASRNSKTVNGKRHTIWMHKEIFGETNGLEIDHINRDCLDNRKCNLRACTRTENDRNRSSKKNREYKRGVYKKKNESTFRSFIKINGKIKNLGRFNTEEEAHLAWLNEASNISGEFLPDEYKYAIRKGRGEVV